MFDWHVLCSFAGYLALMLTIGFLFSKRQESLGDYYLGGRKMNKWVLASNASLVAKYPIFALYELAPGFFLAFITQFVSKLEILPDFLDKFVSVSNS